MPHGRRTVQTELAQRDEELGYLSVDPSEVHLGPWNFLWFKAPAQHPDYGLLRSFVHVLVRRFELDDRVPACWELHAPIVQELAELYRVYTEGRIGRSKTADRSGNDEIERDVEEAEALVGESAVFMREHLPNALSRIQTMWRGRDCANGHQTRRFTRWAEDEAQMGVASGETTSTSTHQGKSLDEIFRELEATHGPLEANTAPHAANTGG